MKGKYGFDESLLAQGAVAFVSILYEVKPLGMLLFRTLEETLYEIGIVAFEGNLVQKGQLELRVNVIVHITA